MNRRTQLKKANPLALIIVVALAATVSAGSLTPAMGPSSTMKTLQQVEPRKPIHSDDTPVLLSQAGSYYLTSNLYARAINQPHIIEIFGNNITVDLNGFTVEGLSQVGQATDGIFATGNNITIKNGLVRNCRDNGIEASAGTNLHIYNVQTNNNESGGIIAGSGAIIRDCIAMHNGTGIAAEKDGVVIGCAASYNSATGINTSLGCVVKNNSANYNLNGIIARGGIVKNNVANRNDTHGIKVYENAHVIENNCNYNGENSELGCGIVVSGRYGRIEANTVTRNDIGIKADGNGVTANLIVKNHAQSNITDNYQMDIVLNKVGTLVAHPVGAGPWDNFDF